MFHPQISSKSRRFHSVGSSMSSSRQEYRRWTGARPAKSARRNPPAQYSSPGTDATHVQRETSYQAAYSGEAQSRSTVLLQGENVIIPSASGHIQPAAVPQPLPPVLQAGASTSSSGLQQNIQNERAELCGTIKGEVSKLWEPIRQQPCVDWPWSAPLLLNDYSLHSSCLGKAIQYLVPQQRKVTQQFKTGRSVLDHTVLVLHSLLCPE